ncbi:methylmalonate-semialdehyde dehydrogenase [Limnochorda pilosa]|uniref:methylmalonate-semialdehyde dehydrogenase (CoA acylating) n=2 Tax=Limnochorda pilosa TaxID=1555112 RepID=A0A0K2SNY0_LIMPI|nr:methylmalonate-semialdehyde dehydrogenase [Limnochorda pilosa]
MELQSASEAKLKVFIGGRWRESRSEEVREIPNPATGELLGRVPYSTSEEVSEAVAAAAEAFHAWRATPAIERARVLFRYKALLEDHLEELARIVTLENGKTLAEARGEVRRGIEVVEFATGAPTLLLGEFSEDVTPGIDNEMVRAPIGVVAGLCPFNFPVMIPLWMFPIALACGNTFILKPSERTPLAAVRLVELLEQAGLPPGVLNVVFGAQEVAEQLMEAPAVKAVSFVGSQPVAKYVYEKASREGKRVQAMSGAKNHLIVMPDADLDRTVDAILASAFGNAGERCLAASVVLAVGEVADPLVERLSKEAANLVVGDGSKADVQMGPVIRPEHKQRILQYIEKGQAEGAHLVVDGRSHKRITGPSTGFYLGPSIFDHVDPGMVIAREEIFGPVLSVIRVADLHEALQILNRSQYGNAASIFTRSGSAAREFRYLAGAGMLGVNIGVAAPMAWLPFSGWKASFYGDLHATGKDAVRFYTETKVVISRW